MSRDLLEKVLNQSQTPVWLAGYKSGFVLPIQNTIPGNVLVNLPSGYLDAFGRQRVSNSHTIFDSKQTINNAPLFWDDDEVSGSGTASSHSVNNATTTISVANLTAGERVRQTYRWFNYEPGKGQLIILTCANLTTGTGITKLFGYGNDENGLFIVSQDGVISFRRRSFTSGVAIDVDVPQTSWGIDKLDGNGPSGITLDPSKVQVAFISFEWLGAGDIAFGFFNNQEPVLCHIMNVSNVLNTVYMSTPNLPLRYSIENDGSGGADTFGHICSSVISEGGTNSTGKTGYISLGASLINANSVGTVYALVGLRLKAATLGTTINLEGISIIVATNDNFEWMLIWNPTIAGGGLTWTDITNYSVQRGLADVVGNPSVTTITGGTILAGGHGNSSIADNIPINNALVIGSSIAGVVDTIILCVRPFTSNANISGGMVFRELT